MVGIVWSGPQMQHTPQKEMRLRKFLMPLADKPLIGRSISAKLLLLDVKDLERQAHNLGMKGCYTRAAQKYEEAADKMEQVIKIACMPRKKYREQFKRLLSRAVSEYDSEIHEGSGGGPEMYVGMAKCCARMGDNMFADEYKTSARALAEKVQNNPDTAKTFEITRLERELVGQRFDEVPAEKMEETAAKMLELIEQLSEGAIAGSAGWLKLKILRLTNECYGRFSRGFDQKARAFDRQHLANVPVPD